MTMPITIIYSFFMADIPFGLVVTVTERGGSRDSVLGGPRVLYSLLSKRTLKYAT